MLARQAELEAEAAREKERLEAELERDMNAFEALVRERRAGGDAGVAPNTAAIAGATPPAADRRVSAPVRMPGAPLPGGGAWGASAPAPPVEAPRPTNASVQPAPPPSTRKATDARAALLAPAQFFRGKKLGSGVFSDVYLALNAESGDMMALKVLELRADVHASVRGDAARACADEIADLATGPCGDHPNVARFYGTSYDADSRTVTIMSEYVPGRSLRSRGEVLDEGAARFYARQMLEGLQALHAEGIVHRALHTGNVLIGLEGSVKV